MVLKIVKYPDPILFREAEPVTAFDEALAKTVDDMFETMYAARGVGLAAPQVNLPLRLFVVNAEPDGVETHGRDAVRATEHHFINAEILEASGEQSGEEGCLSIPGVSGNVTRADRVVVRYQTLDRETHTQTFTGYLARAVQHEYDHIRGRLFLDLLTPTERTLAQRGLKALRAKYEAAPDKGGQRPAGVRVKPRKRVKR